MSMLSNSLKNLVSKPATRLYPAVPANIQPNCRGRIEYDMNKCIWCMMCSRRCPTVAIESDKAAQTHKVFRMRCIACGACVEACPTDAITMLEHYADASYAPTVDTYHQEGPVPKPAPKEKPPPCEPAEAPAAKRA